jgi:ribosomal protein L3 glutamine methyltransferase
LNPGKRQTAPAPSTVRDHWRRITRRFAAAGLAFGHGTGAARDEAAWLVCSVLDIAFDDLDAALEHAVTPVLARRLEELADRRIESRAPLA